MQGNESNTSKINTDPLINIEDTHSNEPILLFDDGNHQVYWLGTQMPNVFRVNIYLIKDGDEIFIIDPGSRSYFEEVRSMINKIGDAKNVKGLILSHQDPDVSASMIDWINVNPEIKIITSRRTNILLPHYGNSNYVYYDIGDVNSYEYRFESGRKLSFVNAHFLHFPGAIATFDETSKIIFTGDVWAALDIDNNYVLKDFDKHVMKMNLFHIDYMASNKACRGFVEEIENLGIEAIAPQHGSVIPEKFVNDALEYLRELECGLDLLYPDDL